MRFKIQVVIDNDDNETIIEDIVTLDKASGATETIGLTITESKRILKAIQETVIQQQSQSFVQSNRACPCCRAQRRIKGYHSIQYRTLFDIVVLKSPRLYRCGCDTDDNTGINTRTFSLLKQWFSEPISPELKYIETKWASLMPYGMTADLLKDVLPVSHTLNASTIKNHLESVAKRMESELKEKPAIEIGCGNDWAKLPKPDKPMTVGIDGGYVKNWHAKNTNFEVVAGKSFSKTRSAKRFCFVQKHDADPRHRLLHVLKDQGMQMNQQIDFLSDGAENLRNLQWMMYPEAEHTLDWFHVTMRITVLGQFAKGLEKSDPDVGQILVKHIESAKWFLWHGNVVKALDRLEDCFCSVDDDAIQYRNKRKFLRHLSDMDTY